MTKYNTRLQVPIQKTLVKKAKKRAEDLGYSSVQEIVRVFLKGFSEETIEPVFEKRDKLSPQAAARYDRMIKDVLSGKEKTYTYDPTRSLADQFQDIDDED